MSNKFVAAILITILLTSWLSACTMDASTPVPEPAPAEQPTQGLFDALPTEQVVSASETAAAAEAEMQTEAAPAEGTPAPAGAAATPQPTTAVGGVQPTAVTNLAMTPQVQAMVVAPTPVRPTTYVLQKGEWPICIARRYNLDLNQFFQMNGLNMQSRLPTGTVLNIPQGGMWLPEYGPRSLAAHPVAYTVQPGQTIYDVACVFGDVAPETIGAANALQPPYNLTPGQVLNIP